MEKKDLFAVLGRKPTKEILELLDNQGIAQYKNVRQVASYFKVENTVQALLDLHLIHSSEKGENTWYEATEKGRKVVQCLRELEELVKE